VIHISAVRGPTVTPYLPVPRGTCRQAHVQGAEVVCMYMYV
jgi:hypothetical protein